MSKNVVVVAVHPDDESLGAGGTLLKYKKKGYNLFWLIVTGMKKEYGWSQERIDKRESEINTVSDLYGFTETIKLDFKPAGLDEYPVGELVGSISKVFSRVKPNIVILPNRSDIHTDHTVTFDAAFSCTKKFRYPSISQIMTMEVLSETDFSYKDEFIPNYFVNITEHFEGKLHAIEQYESEVIQHPFPRSKRSIEALAVLRGAQAGCEYAEAFHLLKCIEE